MVSEFYITDELFDYINIKNYIFYLIHNNDLFLKANTKYQRHYFMARNFRRKEQHSLYKH